MGQARTTDVGTVLVLLAEDEPAVRGLVKKILERAGFRVLPAEDGEAAWELASALDEPIDLLITDVVMPRLYGTDLASRLARVQPELPVLFMSGYTDNDRLRRGVLDPGEAFLEKPFSPDELLGAARRLLACAPSRERAPVEHAGAVACDAVTGEAAEPEAVEPEVAEPDAVDPGVVDPDVVDPLPGS